MTYRLRVLVTGSRDWDNRRQIYNVMTTIVLTHDIVADEFILVSGACPTGADRMAEEIAEELGWTVERYPADWAKYGRSAGFKRNSKMVQLGADLCIAFIKNESKGATMTARLAEEAGIETVRYIE
jgi:hypothetical protein